MCIQIGFLLAAVAAAALAASAPGTGKSPILAQWNIGGEGSWDGLTASPSAHRLYVAHGNRVSVLDTQTGSVTGQISGLENVHSVVLDPAGPDGWLTDGPAGVLRVFDQSTFQIESSLPAGFHPAGLAYDTASGLLWVLPETGHTAAVVDPHANGVFLPVAMPGRPASVVPDGSGDAFVGFPALNKILRMSSNTRKVESSWSLPGCVGPQGLALDRVRHVLYAACEDRKIVSLDARSGKLLGSAAVAEGTRELALDPDQRVLFAAAGSGEVTSLRTFANGRLAVKRIVKTQPGTRTLCIDPENHRVYVASARFGLRTGEASEELLFRPTPVAGTFTVFVIAP